MNDVEEVILFKVELSVTTQTISGRTPKPIILLLTMFVYLLTPPRQPGLMGSNFQGLMGVTIACYKAVR